ncbi:13822_t:CDS:2, partial [Racocetra persica]
MADLEFLKKMTDLDSIVKPSEKKHFTFDNIPDLTGKVAVVTGGNAGIGYITCRELAKKNAHVFVLSRNIERGQAAVEKIKSETDGIQEEFGVNHVGHFLFTKLLLPKIKASQPARIVNLSSHAHRFVPEGGIEFEKLNDPNAFDSIP